MADVSRIERVPPHNLEAEQAILASMLVDRERIPLVARHVGPRKYYRTAHAHVHRAIMALYDRDEPADLLTVREQLRSEELLESVGGYVYLMDLVGAIPTTAHAEHYAKIVSDKSLKRDLIRFGDFCIEQGFDEEQSGLDAYKKVEEKFLALHTGRHSSLVSVQDVGSEFMQGVEDRMEMDDANVTTGCLTTGLPDLDYMVQPAASDLLILAARPAMGKTSKMLNFARHVATYAPVVIYSLEMSKEQLYMRMVQDITGISTKRQRGKLTADEYRKVSDAYEELYALDLYINDSATTTVADIRSDAKQMMARGKKPALIAVDYIQLMADGASAKKNENRTQEVGHISRGLKLVAREISCCVLALSQLSRAVESRPDKKPQLSDLRESGSIEQDADIVQFIYREEYYFPKKVEARGKATIIIAKHRNGPVGEVELLFDASRTRFSCETNYTPKWRSDDEIP